MTVDATEFDKELRGHSAIELKNRVHAVVSEYTGVGHRQVTECGLVLDEEHTFDIGPREAFTDGPVSMCRECWPEFVIDD